MENNRVSLRFLPEFVIKILAILFMTMDHLSLFLYEYPKLATLANVFSCFGRMAFPLFIFMIAEGVNHTSNIKKYLLRLATLGIVILVGQIIVYQFIDSSLISLTSPIVDLFLVAITICLLKRKDIVSLLSIIPIGYMILCFIVQNLERNNDITVYFLPTYLRADYSIYGLFLGLSFAFSKEITTKLMKIVVPEAETAYEGSTDHLVLVNFFNAFVIIFFGIGFYITHSFLSISYIPFSNQAFSCLAAIPLLFYNGERGYNKPWFKYGCYFYFPIHIIIIYIIFALI